MIKNLSVVALSTFIFISSDYNVFSKEKSITIDNNNLYSDESMMKEAYKAFSTGNYEKASFLYSKLSKKFPNNDDYIISLAHSLFMNKNYKDAYSKYNFLVNNSGNNNYVSQSSTKMSEINNILKNNKKSALVNKSVSIQKETENKKNIVTIEEDEKDNYLCNKNDPTILNDETESFRRWEKEDLPIKVFIPLPPAKFNLDNPEKYIQWIKTSMQRWSSKIPALVKYTYVNSPSKANITVNWNDYFTDDSWGNAQLPHYDSKLKRRVSTINMAVRAKLSDKEVFFSEIEFIQVATHEVGHALGLAHSYKSYGNDDIMYPSYRSMIPGSEPDITQRDINSLVKLYSLKRENHYKCN